MPLILAIETSCDETAAAVIEDGHRIRSNVVASQIELHRPYGGVFPEIASRQHVFDLVPVIERALADSGAGWGDLAALAVTRGPGLAGSLLVGVNAAKAIAWGRGLPIIAVNHLEGHLYSNWLDEGGRIDPAALTRPSLARARCGGPRLPAAGADRFRRAHRDHPDGGPRAIPAAGRHAGRRGRRSVRQGGPPPGAELSRRAGHPARSRGRQSGGLRLPARADDRGGAPLQLQLQRPEDGRAAPGA